MYGEGLRVRRERYASMAGMSVRTCTRRERTPCRRFPLMISCRTASTPRRYASRSSSPGNCLHRPVRARGCHEVEVQVVDPRFRLVQRAGRSISFSPVVHPDQGDRVRVVVEDEEHVPEEEQRVRDARGDPASRAAGWCRSGRSIRRRETRCPPVGRGNGVASALVLPAEMGKHVQDVAAPSSSARGWPRPCS